MALFTSQLVPLAVLSLGLAMLLGGRLSQVLAIVGTVMAGVAVLLALVQP
jgi:hypothetical protein